VQQRDLDWEGLHNVRDLGGHPTGGGKQTRFGAYVRADNVDRLTDAGWQALVEYGVGTVVDLRYAEEREVDPPVDLPIVSIHRPLVPNLAHPDWEEIHQLSLSVDVPESTKVVYLEFLDRYRDRFGDVVGAIASAEGDSGVVFYCMAGKDRTGLVAALLLAVAGAERTAIAQDYALSGQNLRAFLDGWIDTAGDEDERALRTRIGAAPAEAMLGVLDAVDERYGGVDEYLRGAGVTDELLERVRARLVG
jgi:protein tyrosine/serine phosphatase